MTSLRVSVFDNESHFNSFQQCHDNAPVMVVSLKASVGVVCALVSLQRALVPESSFFNYSDGIVSFVERSQWLLSRRVCL